MDRHLNLVGTCANAVGAQQLRDSDNRSNYFNIIMMLIAAVVTIALFMLVYSYFFVSDSNITEQPTKPPENLPQPSSNKSNEQVTQSTESSRKITAESVPTSPPINSSQNKTELVTATVPVEVADKDAVVPSQKINWSMVGKQLILLEEQRHKTVEQMIKKSATLNMSDSDS